MKKLGYLLSSFLILGISMAALNLESSPICPQCNGKRINARLKAPGVGNYIFAEIPINSDDKKTTVYAWLCLSCGYVELHTCPSKSPETLAQVANEDQV